jgi:hypothetical protein
MRGKRWHVVLDDIEMGCAKSLLECISVPVISESGKIAYAAAEGEHAFVAVGGEISDLYEAVGLPVFTADETRCAFKALRAGRECIIVDNQPGTVHDPAPPYLDAEKVLDDLPVFTQDGRTVAYRAQFGSKQSVVSEDTAGEMLDSLAGGPAFGLANRLVYFGFQDRSECIVVQGRLLHAFDRIWLTGPRLGYSNRRVPVLADGGRKVVFGAQIGSQLWWQAIDLYGH